MITSSKKLISLFLIFSLMMLSVNLYAKKKGVEVIVTKKNGQQIGGELITVKKDSLLLLFAGRIDISVGIEEIKVIRIVKKSTFWKGPGLGLLIGAGIGGILGRKLGNSVEGETGGGVAEWVLLGGAAFGIAGYLLGDILGPKKGKDKTILLEGMSDSEIIEAMDKLRKKARIRDY
jgi:hypothetical protein